MKDIFERVTITVTPKSRTDDFEIAVSGQDRVTITEVSRDANTGKIVIDVRGISRTPKPKPNGDTTIEAKLDGVVCGSTKVIVIIPYAICGPCDENGSQGSPVASALIPCPEGSHRTPENLVLDSSTSPAWHGLPPCYVMLVTVWIEWMTIQVCDQFGDPLDSMYSGCCVEEFVFPNVYRINQQLSDEGTYQDPVFWAVPPPTSIVLRSSQAAQDWPSDPTLPMVSSDCKPQNIQIQICGHQLEVDIKRRFCHKIPDCAWVVCPGGEIIV